MRTVETRRYRASEVARAAVIGIAVALTGAYAALWLAGAVELLTHDEVPSGPSCAVFLSAATSNAAVGHEADRWVGGSFPGRPGKVCVVEPSDAAAFSTGQLGPDLSAQFTNGAVEFPVLSDADLGGAILSLAVFAGVALAATTRSFRQRRRRALRDDEAHLTPQSPSST